MLRRVPTEGSAAGDVDDASNLGVALAEMRDSESAEVGGRLKVDGQGPLPRRVPFLIPGIFGDAFVNAGVVDEYVDASAEPAQSGLPHRTRRASIAQIASDQLIASR